MTTVRAIFDGRVLVPEGKVNLPVGRLLELQVLEPDGVPTSNDSMAALRTAIAETPHLSEADLAELEIAIDNGRLPVQHRSPFDPE